MTDHDKPTLLTQAASLVGAVVDHALDGFRQATPQVAAQRERLCRECPHAVNGVAGCSSCGCGVIGALSFIGLDMNLKRKLASSACPDGRWGAT